MRERCFYLETKLGQFKESLFKMQEERMMLKHEKRPWINFDEVFTLISVCYCFMSILASIFCKCFRR